MKRRVFVSSLAGGVITAAAHFSAQDAGRKSSPSAAAPEFYIWRQYILRNGTQPRRLGEYLQNAAIPAMNRLGYKPVGVFEVITGLPTPSVFVLIPCPTLDSLRMLEDGLDRDEQFQREGAAYIDAPATDPAYIRQEVSLLSAFPRMPRIEMPAATGAKGPRLFELRIYESPTEKGHRAKVRMFEEMGEIDIFRRVGLAPVFFARTLVGPRMPNLVYLLVHENMAAREKSWSAFRNDPEWKKVGAAPGYSNAEIVSNITTIFLQPAPHSQI
jgi:hypothetical protein